MTCQASQCTPLGAGHSGLHSNVQTSLHYTARPSTSRTYKFLNPGDGNEHGQNTLHEILTLLHTCKKSKVMCFNQQFLKLRFPSQFMVFIKAQVSQYERLLLCIFMFIIYCLTYQQLLLPAFRTHGRGQR